MDNKTTSSFLSAIERCANEEATKIEEEAKSNKDQKLETIKESSLEEYNSYVELQTLRQKADIISDYAKKTANVKSELILKRNEIIDDVKESVIKKLLDYSTSNEYSSYILNSAKEIKEHVQDTECVVYLRNRDQSLKDSISNVLNVSEFIFDNTITLGGIKVYSKSQGILLDDTFDSKLDDEMKEFLSYSNLKVV